jgi:hypothetical protein
MKCDMRTQTTCQAVTRPDSPLVKKNTLIMIFCHQKTYTCQRSPGKLFVRRCWGTPAGGQKSRTEGRGENNATENVFIHPYIMPSKKQSITPTLTLPVHIVESRLQSAYNVKLVPPSPNEEMGPTSYSPLLLYAHP